MRSEARLRHDLTIRVEAAQAQAATQRAQPVLSNMLEPFGCQRVGLGVGWGT